MRDPSLCFFSIFFNCIAFYAFCIIISFSLYSFQSCFFFSSENIATGSYYIWKINKDKSVTTISGIFLLISSFLFSLIIFRKRRKTIDNMSLIVFNIIVFFGIGFGNLFNQFCFVIIITCLAKVSPVELRQSICLASFLFFFGKLTCPLGLVIASFFCFVYSFLLFSLWCPWNATMNDLIRVLFGIFFFVLNLNTKNTIFIENRMQLVLLKVFLFYLYFAWSSCDKCYSVIFLR